MNMLLKVLFVIVLTTLLELPSIEAASISQSYSLSTSATPSFSGSASNSYSPSQSYSTSAAHSQSATYSSSLTFSASLLFSRSGQPTISATVGTSPPPVLPPGTYRFENHCPFQSTSICPFWGPNVFPTYKLTVMDSAGNMKIFTNIKVPIGEVPQFPLSWDSTDGFINPAGTYKLQLFGCDPNGLNCIEAYTPLVVVTSPRRKPVCDPNYICRQTCKLISPGLVECSWKNVGQPFKRVILRVRYCLSLSTLARVFLGGPRLRRTISVRRPRNPLPTSIRYQLPLNSICSVQLIHRWHPDFPKNIVKRFIFFT